MNDISINSAVIERELDWLRDVIDMRLDMAFDHRPVASPPPSPLFTWPVQAGENGSGYRILEDQDGNALTEPEGESSLRIHSGECFEILEREEERVRIQVKKSGDSGWVECPFTLPEWFVPGRLPETTVSHEKPETPFREWIHAIRRYQQCLNAYEQGDISHIKAPALPDQGSAYADFVLQKRLSYASRLLLALAISTHLRPELADRALAIKDPRDDRPLTEAGGVIGQNFRGLIPTGLTWIFLLSGDNIGIRMEILGSLNESHPLLGSANIIHLGEGKEYEPVLNGPVILDQLWLRQLTIGDIDLSLENSPAREE